MTGDQTVMGAFAGFAFHPAPSFHRCGYLPPSQLEELGLFVSHIFNCRVLPRRATPFFTPVVFLPRGTTPTQPSIGSTMPRDLIQTRWRQHKISYRLVVAVSPNIRPPHDFTPCYACARHFATPLVSALPLHATPSNVRPPDISFLSCWPSESLVGPTAET
jgi:hypothetical protein